MSFGFSKSNRAISRAIENVKEKRPVIFLSSAGNSPGEDESFPARHPSVISIYAANYKGYFSESNAMIEMGGNIALGTFGDDIPDSICADFEAREQFRRVCRPGSSIATAVASGISATMLAYCTVLPKLQSLSLDQTHRLRWVWETEGMEVVLKKTLARSETDQKRFFDLVWFWTQRSKDDARLNRILEHLYDVERKGELRTEQK